MEGASPSSTVTGQININDGTITVNGNCTLNGYKNASNRYHQTIEIGSSGELIVLGDLTTTDNGGAHANTQIDISSGGTLEVGGNITLAESDEDIVLGGSSSTIIFNKNGAQNIFADGSFEYENLTLKGSGVKTLEDNVTINGKLSIQGSSTFSLGGHSLTWGNNSSLEYSGSSEQTTGDELNGVGNVQTIIINNSNHVNLNSSETCDDALVLTSGKLKLGPNDLTVSATNGITGGSTSSYIVTNGSGSLTYTTDGSTVFPCGTSTYYNPVTLTPSIDETFSINISSSFSNSPNDADRVVNAEFNINTSGTPGETDISISWDQAQEAASFQSNDANVQIGHWNGSDWTEYDASYNENSPEAGRSTASINNYNDGYSPFAIGAGKTALPVDLLLFEGEEEQDHHVHLHWVTLSEINNDYFEVQKSKDAKNFDVIATIEGKGNSNERNNYYFVDEDPFDHTYYYRLKQVDFDGKYEYSEMIVVDVKEHLSSSGVKHSFVIFPNPNSGEQINIKSAEPHDANEEIDLYVTDAEGKLIFSKILTTGYDGNFVTGISTEKNLKPGMYIISEKSKSHIDNQTLIIHY